MAGTTMNSVNHAFKQWAKKLPPVKKLLVARDQLRGQNQNLFTQNQDLLQQNQTLLQQNQQLTHTVEWYAETQKNMLYPAGHFYSAIPDIADLRQREAAIFGPLPTQIAGIDLRYEAQVALLTALQPYYADQPFTDQQAPDRRYWFENDYFCHADGLSLHLLLRHLKPRRVIEVGSGFSSAVMLDTRDRFFEAPLDLTFIEPYPDRLESLLQESDRDRATIIAQPVQEVPLDTFAALQAGDFLFIDSTHVMKTGSDVNRILFDILPMLAPGVFIHFHDIFYPFEYLQDWVYKGFAWNEIYALRSFLQYNTQFQMVLFNHYMEQVHREWLAQQLPLWLKRNVGGSLWIQKVA
jgi:predicted O-methyltransferase YrrM